MRRLLPLLLLPSLLLLGGSNAPPPPAEIQLGAAYDRLRVLLSEPLQAMRAGDAAEAERRLERVTSLVRRAEGRGSVLEADLLWAFGLALYYPQSLEATGDERARADAPRFLRRGLAAARVAFGTGHREVGYRLAELAQVTVRHDWEAYSPEAEAVLEEALAIFRAGLQPPDEALLQTIHLLVTQKRNSGDPRKLEAAASLLEEAIAHGETHGAHPDSMYPPWSFRIELAVLRARQGRADDALAPFRTASEEVRRASADAGRKWGWLCDPMTAGAELPELLDAHGATAQAAEARLLLGSSCD